MKKVFFISGFVILLLGVGEPSALAHDGPHTDTHTISHFSYNGVSYVQFIFHFHTKKLWRWGNHYYRAEVGWTYSSTGWEGPIGVRLKYKGPSSNWYWYQLASLWPAELCPYFGVLDPADQNKEWCWDPEGIRADNNYGSPDFAFWEDDNSCSRLLYEEVRRVPHGPDSTWVPFITDPAQNSLNSVICADLPCLGYSQWCTPVHEDPCPIPPPECAPPAPQ